MDWVDLVDRVDLVDWVDFVDFVDRMDWVDCKETKKGGAPDCIKRRPMVDQSCLDQSRSNRSRFITLSHADMKSFRNFSSASSHP